MSGVDDYPDEMFRRFELDDDAIDSILRGRDPGRTDLAMLAAFVDDARSVTLRPAPEPSASLAAILAEGLSTEDRDLLGTAASNVPGPVNQPAGLPKWRRRKMAVAQLLTGLSVGAKAVLGIGVAAAAVGGAGAAGALPGPVQHAVASTVSHVSPFGFPDSASIPDNTNSHADFGKSVSSDATGTSDGQPGVDGQSVASTAPENGLSVARDTPAGDHVPSSVPPDSHSSDGSTENESSNSDAGSHSSGPPASVGSQSSNGTDTASNTPAGDHVPAQVPPPRP